MKLNTQTYRSFLLGKLAESEREELEGRFLEDSKIFEEIEAVEVDLVDEWSRGELSSEDRRQIERSRSHSPRLRERMRVASTLAQRLEPIPDISFVRRYRPWLLAASLTGLGLLSWVTSSLFVADNVEVEIAEIILWGDSLRSGNEAEKVVLAASDDHLTVKIDLGSGALYPEYMISVRGSDGSTIWSPLPLKPESLPWGLALVAEIPSELLGAGVYQVELQGIRGGDLELLAFYSLEVVWDTDSN